MLDSHINNIWIYGDSKSVTLAPNIIFRSIVSSLAHSLNRSCDLMTSSEKDPTTFWTDGSPLMRLIRMSGKMICWKFISIS